MAVAREAKGPVHGMVGGMGRTYYNAAALLGLLPILLMKLLFCKGGNWIVNNYWGSRAAQKWSRELEGAEVPRVPARLNRVFNRCRQPFFGWKNVG